MNRVIDRIKKRFSFKRTTSHINTGKERYANVITKTDLTRGSDGIDKFSGSLTKKPENLGMSREIANNVNKTLIELTQAIQGQNEEILTLKREILELNNLKSLEQELKNAIQVQKDGIKSYHIMKKEVSTIKDYLQMVYGKKCFDRKK